LKDYLLAIFSNNFVRGNQNRGEEMVREEERWSSAGVLGAQQTVLKREAGR
jgi:hypothetical protein